MSEESRTGLTICICGPKEDRWVRCIVHRASGTIYPPNPYRRVCTRQQRRESYSRETPSAHHEYFYLALLNVARCDVDVEASQDSDIAAFTTETDESQLVDVAFSILPPKIQIKILTEVKLTWKSHCPTLVAALNSPSHRLINIFQTRMNASEIRRERIFARVDRVNLLKAYSAQSSDKHNTRFLRSTAAFTLINYEHSNLRFEKEFFWMPSVRKLKMLALQGECDFSDNDLSAMYFRILFLHRCHISECALRKFIEVMFTPVVLVYAKNRSSLATRSILQREDVAVHWQDDVLYVNVCKYITPSEVYLDGGVDGNSYTSNPARFDNQSYFLLSSTRD
uniref:F-box domain-containing protein n=1 Tax=Heterorhabditis bacteriophora TaxID=37862 RepID=A0A1I7WBP0_HETBA